jgi:hypothetical protein
MEKPLTSLPCAPEMVNWYLPSNPVPAALLVKAYSVTIRPLS